jgi:hypothetical protein
VHLGEERSAHHLSRWKRRYGWRDNVVVGGQP